VSDRTEAHVAPRATAAWEPRIVAFFCNWCTYTAADLAGVSRMKHAPNVRIIRVMCSGRVDPQFVLEAFAKGADGVLIGGCHIGDCHYVEGNYKAVRRVRCSGASSWGWASRRTASGSNGSRPPKGKGKAGHQRHGGQGARARPARFARAVRRVDRSWSRCNAPSSAVEETPVHGR